MFFLTRAFTVISCLIVVAFFATLGCEVENANDVDCRESDCQTACVAKGYTKGMCKDEVCTCSGKADKEYPWTSADKDGGQKLDGG